TFDLTIFAHAVPEGTATRCKSSKLDTLTEDTMTTRNKLPEDDLQQPTSSPGNESSSVTPKDVGSDTATAKDRRERKLASENEEERTEEQLDDAVEMTFPASDPIAIPDPEQHH